MLLLDLNLKEMVINPFYIPYNLWKGGGGD